MRNRRTTLAAATAILAVAAALGVYLVAGHTTRQPVPVPDERRAQELTDGYRHAAVARLPAGLRYSEAVRSLIACADSSRRYQLSSRYALMPDSASAVQLADLREYWLREGYRIIDDTMGQDTQLLVENMVDGFRIGIVQRSARYLQLAISSPCLVLAAPPAAPVLQQDLAVALSAYEQYVAGQLNYLAGDVATLRGAVGNGDNSRARTAWLTAALRWDAIGAAYGSFGDFADAIDSLPQGLPDGTGDADFTGLHRIEYGLWHDEPPTSLLPVVDMLATDVNQLRTGLHEALPAPADLPLRAHEILEDAQRGHLIGLTDLGGHAGLAETLAGVDATAALLGMLAPLIESRRPALLPGIRADLDTLRQALLDARTSATWPAPTDLSPSAHRRIDAALGGVLEKLAAVPGLLEVVGS